MLCRVSIYSSKHRPLALILAAFSTPTYRQCQLVDDLRLVLGVLGVAEDEAVVARVLTEPAEGGGLLEALVQTGVLRAVQVGGEAAVVFGVSRRLTTAAAFSLAVALS